MKKIFFVSTENGCNNNCIGCEKETLNKHSIVLKPNEIIDGLNKGEINQSLIVFSKKLNYKTRSALINQVKKLCN